MSTTTGHVTDQATTAISLEVRDDRGVAMVNSRTVAKHFGKRHADVLESIDAILTHGGNLRHADIPWFHEVRTEHSAVPSRFDRSFDLTRDGFTLVAMGWTGAKALHFKIAYISAFNRMEETFRSAAAPAANLNDPQALRAALLGYTERVIALEGESAMLGAKVEHLEPKAKALDLIAGKSGAENVSTVAKGLRVRPGDLFTWLNAKGWLFRARDGAPWRAYQAKIDAGFLTVRETPDRTRYDRTFMQVLVTPKGRAKMAEMLVQGDLLRQRGPASRDAAQ